MPEEHDTIIIGTGAAAVSAAGPIVRTGARVLLVDAGRDEPTELPTGDYLTERERSSDQWRWLLGPPGLNGPADPRSSPKFRVPTARSVFADDAAADIKSEGFFPVMSLASGGLTRAWGAGVATFNCEELKDFPLTRTDLDPYYRSVAVRIGVSGPRGDDLSDYYGLDGVSLPPVELDALGLYLEARYASARTRLSPSGFVMGRARMAVITRDRAEWMEEGRHACDSRRMCLWGCSRRAIYSADMELSRLLRNQNCVHLGGALVHSIASDDRGWVVRGTHRTTAEKFELRSRKLVLGAGVLSTTRLVLRLTGFTATTLRLLSVPSAAFALLVPALLNLPTKPATGLAQHCFVLRGEIGGDEVSGGLFPSMFLPLSEFIPHVPLGRRIATSVLAPLMPAITVGNVFLPSRLSSHSVRLAQSGRLHVRGGFADEMDAFSAVTARRLRVAFRRLGAFTLPGSFTIGAPGSDAHYAATLPMRESPGPLETDRYGAMHGFPGLHIVDGSVLSSLPTKAHTFTIMANAERIGTHIARSLASTACR